MLTCGGCSGTGEGCPKELPVLWQPTGRQLHVAAAVSKHQPLFRAHTHPRCAGSATRGRKGKGRRWVGVAPIRDPSALPQQEQALSPPP